ncbi:glycosyltransferase [Patescibacteria group bacterium]
MNNKKINQNKIAIFHLSLFGGGGEKVLLDLAKGFAESNIEVDLLLGKTKGQFSEKNLGDVNVINFNSRRISFNIPKLTSYLRRERPVSILVTSEHSAIIVIFAKLFSFTDTKVFIRVGNPYSILFKRYNNMRDKLTIPPLTRLLYRFAHGFVANACGIADDFARTIGISRDRVSVIHNPKFIEDIQKKTKEPVDHAWFKNKNVPIVITNARISVQKNLETLLHAVAVIKKKRNIRLIVVGHGGGDELRKLAEDLDIADSIDVLGFVQNPYAYMAQSDMFVLPSLWEGLPNSLIEALVCGVPAIAGDCIGGGSREILAPDTDIHKRMEFGIEYGKYGILVAPKDIEAIVQAIEELLDNKELRDKYIEKGLERSKDFSLFLFLIRCVLLNHF